MAGFTLAFASQGGVVVAASPSPRSNASGSPGSASPPPQASVALGKSVSADGASRSSWPRRSRDGGGAPVVSTAVDLFSVGAFAGGAAMAVGGGARMSPIHGQGRHPSECPCGAAALYCEVRGFASCFGDEAVR